MQFSTRQILLATLLVAFVLGGFIWLRKLTGINPSSESVWVAGEKADANWQGDEWRHTTGLFLPATQFASANWSGQARIKVYQPLLTVAYKNYFGQEVYRANVYLDGHRTDDWLHYLIRPMPTGGGIVDAGTTVSCDQSLGNASIKLVATQYLNSQRLAKRLELVFDRVGDTFIPRNTSEQRVADEALD
ncbi:MAG: hypothetical protein ACOYKN_10895 [Pirellula sp.]|jgi:hypothetical protein